MNPRAPQDCRPAQRRFALLAQVGLALVLALAATGCVYVLPVPVKSFGEGSRHNLNDQTATRFEPCRDTVEEVVLALGEPDGIAVEPLRLTYQVERVHFRLMRGYAFGLDVASVSESWQTDYGRSCVLVFEFDSAGMLQHVESSTAKLKKEEHEQNGQ